MGLQQTELPTDNHLDTLHGVLGLWVQQHSPVDQPLLMPSGSSRVAPAAPSVASTVLPDELGATVVASMSSCPTKVPTVACTSTPDCSADVEAILKSMLPPGDLGVGREVAIGLLQVARAQREHMHKCMLTNHPRPGKKSKGSVPVEDRNTAKFAHLNVHKKQHTFLQADGDDVGIIFRAILLHVADIFFVTDW